VRVQQFRERDCNGDGGTADGRLGAGRYADGGGICGSADDFGECPPVMVRFVCVYVCLLLGALK
jgi:hypothetical protein